MSEEVGEMRDEERVYSNHKGTRERNRRTGEDKQEEREKMRLQKDEGMERIGKEMEKCSTV